MKQTIATAFKFLLLMTLLTGILYPLFITLTAQLIMPYQANGSLIKMEGKTIGSLLIAQHTDLERYFWPRPSFIDYDPLKPSGGSNLGPTSATLKQMIEERKKKIGFDAPSELLYASASGLDPHITIEAAYYQAPRVARARSLDEENLKKLIHSLEEGTILRRGYVNVLLLNKALDDNRI